MENEQNDNRVALSSVFPEQLPEGLIQIKVKDKELLERFLRRYSSRGVMMEVFIELIEDLDLSEDEAWSFMKKIMRED